VNGLRGEAIALAGRVVSYPARDYFDDLHAFADASSGLGIGPTPELAAFVERTKTQSVEELQELYTQTFDMTPACALEVGWHLFGEDYQRGRFLVDMRAKLRAHGIPESGELPDHLASMLMLVAKTDAEEADGLVKNALVPAVDKILGSLQTTGSPFLPAMNAIRQLLLDSAPADAEVSRA
jgi:nitrate reductase molybdenum cofactor assembly chaperone